MQMAIFTEWRRIMSHAIPDELVWECVEHFRVDRMMDNNDLRELHTDTEPFPVIQFHSIRSDK